MVKKSHLFVFAIYIILGIIFVNEPLQVFPSPFDLTGMVIAIAGLMLFAAGFGIFFKFRAPMRYS